MPVIENLKCKTGGVIVVVNVSRPCVVLNASSAHRWLNCPISTRYAQSKRARAIPESSGFAREGKVAHRLCELRLLKMLWGIDPTYADRAIASEVMGDKAYRPEMWDCTDMYLDTIRNTLNVNAKSVLYVEKQVDYGNYAPEGYGTCDCMADARAAGFIAVFDYKHGMVPVNARNNPQTRLYGLGALNMLQVTSAVNVVMFIIQPRSQSGEIVSCEVLSSKDLIQWGLSIREAADAASRGEGVPVPGSWCRYCPGDGVCKASSERYENTLASIERNGVEGMTPSELGRAMGIIDTLEQHKKAVREKIISLIEAGEKVPGYALQIKQGRRTWKDPNAAMLAALAYGYNIGDIAKPISPTAMERLMGVNYHIIEPNNEIRGKRIKSLVKDVQADIETEV